MCTCTNNITEYKQNYFGIYTIAFASLVHLKLPISIKIPVTIPQIVNICITVLSPNLLSLTTNLPEGVLDSICLYIFAQDII